MVLTDLKNTIVRNPTTRRFAPALYAALKELGYRTIFMIRNPRDALVSSPDFAMGLSRHCLHDRQTALVDAQLGDIIEKLGYAR
ncbi:MAG: hypothetical protein ACOC3D_08090 [Pseudomonadota bacterium]